MVRGAETDCASAIVCAADQRGFFPVQHDTLLLVSQERLPHPAVTALWAVYPAQNGVKRREDGRKSAKK